MRARRPRTQDQLRNPGLSVPSRIFINVKTSYVKRFGTKRSFPARNAKAGLNNFSMPSSPSRRAPCIHARMRPLVTKPYETSGLTALTASKLKTEYRYAVGGADGLHLSRIPKLILGTRASRPHLVEKCGQDVRVPRKGIALFCPSRLFVTNSSLTRIFHI